MSQTAARAKRDFSTPPIFKRTRIRWGLRAQTWTLKIKGRGTNSHLEQNASGDLSANQAADAWWEAWKEVYGVDILNQKSLDELKKLDKDALNKFFDENISSDLGRLGRGVKQKAKAWYAKALLGMRDKMQKYHEKEFKEEQKKVKKRKKEKRKSLESHEQSEPLINRPIVIIYLIQF